MSDLNWQFRTKKRYGYFHDEKDYSEIETSYSEKESSVAHIGETAYVTNANSY